MPFYDIDMMSCAKEKSEMNETIVLPDINEISNNAWKRLSTKKIYFGHQSVGDNILQGISDILITNNAIKLNIKERGMAGKSDTSVFIHSSIGENGHPIAKIDSFKNVLQGGIGENVDIAFLKLCFWDIRKDTNVGKVFNRYKRNIRELKEQYSNIQFVHFTVPLMEHANTLITKIKMYLNMDVHTNMDNIKRNELNELILKEYKGKDSLFDIATIESTLPNGFRTYFKQYGNKCYYLASEYTDDGGHLNQMGRKFVAEQLLITLADSY